MAEFISDSEKEKKLKMREEELESMDNPLTYEEFEELEQLKKDLAKGEIIINDKRFKCNNCGKIHYIRIQHVYDGDFPDMQNTKIIIAEIDEETK